MAKINCFTALSDVVIKQLRKNLKASTANNYAGMSQGISEAVATEVERCMRLWGSAGRAAEVMTRCCEWTTVEHTIIYNIDGLDDSFAKTMMTESRRMLCAIPGVREVFSGEAIQDDAKYRYTCQVRFCHPAVLDSYREHPGYIAFIEKLIRPIAGKCIRIDYQTVKPVASEFAMTPYQMEQPIKSAML